MARGCSAETAQPLRLSTYITFFIIIKFGYTEENYYLYFITYYN